MNYVILCDMISTIILSVCLIFDVILQGSRTRFLSHTPIVQRYFCEGWQSWEDHVNTRYYRLRNALMPAKAKQVQSRPAIKDLGQML